MSSFLPRLEETLVDLLLYGDSGALRVSVDRASWTFYVQAGVMVGVSSEPPPEEVPFDGTRLAADMLVAAMQARGAIWEFDEQASPPEFGIFDARRALVDAVGRARAAHELLRYLEPVLEGWPELKVDPDTLTGDVEIQRWLQTLDGLAPGNTRLIHAPSRPGPALGALWVAWKLGDLDLHEGAIEDEDPYEVVDPIASMDAGSPTDHGEPITASLAATEDDPLPTEETAEDDSATARSHEPPAPTRCDASRGPGGSTGDPFVAGVALARAGKAAEALPLLEEAFEEDPDRPGVEEWLGYARFAACRDSDPDRARSGLTLLRDVMYRTGPTGETPILPWILMARAQFERGDLLQARSLLDSVLEREPDDPEAMHIDSLLRAAEEELEKARQKPEGISLARIFRMTGGVALLALLVVATRVVENTSPPHTDYAPEVADLVPLRELHRLTRGWVGVTAPSWTASPGPDELHRLCRTIGEAVHMDDYETLLLLSAQGTLLTECGVPIDGDPGSPAPPHTGGRSSGQ